MEGIMWDRKLKKQQKGNVGSVLGTSVCMWVGDTCTDRERVRERERERGGGGRERERKRERERERER